MSANYEAAALTRAEADETQAELQRTLRDTNPDVGRVEQIRAAAQHLEAAALFYAVMSLVDAQADDGGQRLDPAEVFGGPGRPSRAREAAADVREV